MPNSTLAQMGFLDEDTQQEAVYDLEDTQARSDISTINGKIPSTASSSNKMATASDITDINNKIPSNASSSNKLATISDVSAAYKPKGNATLATLPSLTAEHLNWVYNMTEDFTTTSDFAEGAGKSVKAGNEVGIIDVSTTSTPSYKYTVLGGFVDTSSLQPKTLDTPVEVGGVNRTTVEAALGALANDKEDTILAATPLVKEYDEIMHQEVLRLNQDDAPTNNSNNPVKSGGIYTALADKASKANVIANTELIKDTVGWSGKNKLDTSVVLNLYMDTGNSKYASNNDAHLCVAKVLPNTKYNVTKQAGTQFRVASSQNYPANNVSYTQTIANHTGTKIEITTGANDYYIGVYTTEADIPTCMVYDANILDPTFEPYHESVDKTIDTKITNAIGWTRKNLLNNILKSVNYSGIDLVINEDKSIFADGTCTGDLFYRVANFTVPETGKYIASGISGGSANTYMLFIRPDPADGTYWNITDGEVKLNLYANKKYICNFVIYNGAELDEVNVYPMLRDASISDSSYEPYRSNVIDTLKEAEVIEGKNKCDISNAINATNFISAVDKDGTLHFKDVSTIAWSSKYLAKIELKADEEYIISSSINLVYGRIGMNISPTVVPSSSNTPDITIHTSGVGYAEILGKYVNNVSFKSNANQTVYLWFCNDSNNASHAAFNLKIMVRSASETDPTYEPYYIPLKDSMFPRSEQAVLGAKNICPMPYSSGYTHETNGITFTVNADGSYVANGTATNSAFLEFFRDYNTILEKGKKYIASSGQTANGGTQVYYRESYQSGDWVLLAAAVTEEVEFTVPNNANIILIRGYIGSGNTVSNKTYYPMIRLASDPDNTYVPYAMTNKELTENKIGKTITLTSADDLDNVTETGFYAITTAPAHTPEDKTYATLIVNKRADNDVKQIVIKDNYIYVRSKGGSPASWFSWYKFTGTTVS